jgi:hypothetical protein
MSFDRRQHARQRRFHLMINKITSREPTGNRIPILQATASHLPSSPRNKISYSIENLIIITSFILSFFSHHLQYAFLKVIGETRRDERYSEMEQIFREELIWTISMCIKFSASICGLKTSTGKVKLESEPPISLRTILNIHSLQNV